MIERQYNRHRHSVVLRSSNFFQLVEDKVYKNMLQGSINVLVSDQSTITGDQVSDVAMPARLPTPPASPTVPQLILCADGGGSKVCVVVRSDDGLEVRGTAGPCNV